MKVVEKRKLHVKVKDLFVNNETYTVVRHRAVIEESVVIESQESYKETGIIWVINEEATKAWHDAKNPIKEIEVKSTHVKPKYK
jgi:hypothetical protein